MSDSDVEKAKQEILGYLVKHPQASDDLQGITRFWVTRQRIEAAAETVEQAVDALVKDGLLKEVRQRTPGGEAVYTRYQLKG